MEGLKSCTPMARLYSFKELFADFIAGTPIKRKPWDGYWKYRYGKVEMHSKDGSITNLTDTKDIIFTLSGILMDDWEVATVHNCSVLRDEENLKKRKDDMFFHHQFDPLRYGIEPNPLKEFIKSMKFDGEDDHLPISDDSDDIPHHGIKRDPDFKIEPFIGIDTKNCCCGVHDVSAGVVPKEQRTLIDAIDDVLRKEGEQK